MQEENERNRFKKIPIFLLIRSVLLQVMPIIHSICKLTGSLVSFYTNDDKQP